MLEHMFNSLKNDGKVALLEYREEGDSAKHIKPDHRMSIKQVLKEWNSAGFELVAKSNVLENPDDPRNDSVFAPERRGNTDRFVWKYQKPEAR